MVKIELLDLDGINKIWDVYYSNDINSNGILFAENIEIANIGDFVELDIPSNWIVIGMIPKDNDTVRGYWYSGSV